VDAWDARAIAEAAAAAAFPGEPVALVPAPVGDRLWDIQVSGRAAGWVARLVLDAPVWAGPAFGVELTLCEVDTTPPAPRGAHAYAGGVSRDPRSVVRFRSLPAQPPADFDLALLVPRPTTVADVERVIRSAAGDLLESLVLFDEYTGAGVPPETRSLAWRLTFRHPDRTLRDKEIEGRRAQILRALEEELHVRQRTA
jgi:phenylalanyl-tRNA synthetase beta chain